MASTKKTEETVFQTASGNVQKVNRTAVAKSDFTVFRNFTRYNTATQAALVSGIADRVGRGGETGIRIAPDYTGGVWVHVGNGIWVFVPAPTPPLPPLPPNPYGRLEELITGAMKGGALSFGSTVNTPRLCDISIRSGGREVLNLLAVNTLS
jgi:hypothetical protein